MSQKKIEHKSHKLNKLLEEVIASTAFKTDKSKYRGDLVVITVCAEEYRYNFDIDCADYLESVAVCDKLLQELIEFEPCIKYSPCYLNGIIC